MSASLKYLIAERQTAYHSGDLHLWRFYRDKIRLSIEQRNKQFYTEKVQQLKTNDARKWWNYINKVSGRSMVCQAPSNRYTIDGEIKSSDELATALNDFFLSVNEDIPALDLCQLSAYLPCLDTPPIISPEQVCEYNQFLK